MSMALYEELKETIDHETGEVKTTMKLTSIKHENEPNYIKLYIKDLCKLKDIPKSGNDTLNELLLLTDYQNRIILNSFVKNELCKKLKIKMASLDNNISKLTKNEVLQRLGRGTFTLNPNLFGKGKWQDIKKLRIEWEYSATGRTIKQVETDLTEQTIMDFNEVA
jgi:hypothetical protein